MPANLRTHGHGQGYTRPQLHHSRARSTASTTGRDRTTNIGDVSQPARAYMHYSENLKRQVELDRSGPPTRNRRQPDRPLWDARRERRRQVAASTAGPEAGRNRASAMVHRRATRWASSCGRIASTPSASIPRSSATACRRRARTTWRRASAGIYASRRHAVGATGFRSIARPALLNRYRFDVDSEAYPANSGTVRRRGIASPQAVAW